MKIFYCCILYLFFVFSSTEVTALPQKVAGERNIDGKNTPVIFTKETKYLTIGRYVRYHLDTEEKFTIKDKDRMPFQSLGTEYVRFGYRSEALWFKFSVRNISGEDIYFEISQTATDSIDFYLFENEKPVKKVLNVGDIHPYRNREIDHRNFIFTTPPSPMTQTCYVRIHSISYLTFPPNLLSRKALEKKDQRELAIIWIFSGMMVIMALYNFLVYVSVRENDYLYFAVFNVSCAGHVFACKGLGAQLFWGQYPAFTNMSSTAFLLIVSIGMLLFSKVFLRLKERMPVLNIIVNICAVIFFAIFISVAVFKNSMFSSFSFLLYLIIMSVLSGYAFFRFVKGSRTGLIYTLSWAAFVVFLVPGILYMTGIYIEAVTGKWSLQLGAVSQTLLIAFALSDRIRTITNRLEDLNVHLEQKVEERTIELEGANQELGAMNENLTYINHELEEAQRIAKRDMDMAVNVQRQFLPSGVPRVEGWEIQMVFRPMAGVSGDFYDYYYKEGRLEGVGIFDVSGHGISSGLITMIAKSILFRHFSEGENLPLNVLLNNANENLQREIGQVDNYITCNLFRFRGEEVEYVNAGHCDPLLLSGDDLFFVRDKKGESISGFFLGIDGMSYPFGKLTFQMKQGDFLIMYTDCLIEMKNEENVFLGEEGFMEIVRSYKGDSAEELLRHIMGGFHLFTGGRENLDDDLTLIVMKKE